MPYPSNAILGRDPFRHPAVGELIASWPEILKRAAAEMHGQDAPFARFLHSARNNSPERLQTRARTLFEIIGGRITVLPPDTRHVDYNVIPLRVAEGCQYKCRFCRVKNDKAFRTYSRRAIVHQIEALKGYYAADRINYNALFLAGNDALNADKDVLLFALDRALSVLKPQNSCMQGCRIFLFGSVDSLLAAEPGFFDTLQRMGCRVFINIGLESADPETLNFIGKPITAAKVVSAFQKMQAINGRCDRIEITANFLMDDTLPAGHYPAFVNLAAGKSLRPKRKGALYFSPLCAGAPSQHTLFYFNQLQAISRFPVFLYLIQRV